MRIAVVEQDPSELESLCAVLLTAGHQPQPFGSAADLTRQLRRDVIDLLILDWHTAGSAAPELVRVARERLQVSIPVLLLTGPGRADDIVDGLDAGANDYMIKPIRRSELLARVQALLRRAYPALHQPENLAFGRFVFELRSARLSSDGTPIELTQKEFDLALLLLRNLGRPLSRAYLLESVWSRDIDVPSRTLDTHISRVRSKLRLQPEYGFKLTPVYSYGYRLEQLTSDIAAD